ncbi:MAG: response regulator transcription factor, partial [Deltaproteobacteria bacterium]|nr:response regulator transcription factor [Deltaproteobacteria bacterium]
MRLLVVEDEPRLREQLVGELKRSGYATDAAADGQKALFLGTENPYDLAIVDLGLPRLDGVELIRRLRRADRSFPILILTARDAWQDKVTGLEAGADDYLVKPFHIEELKARLSALLRRAGGQAEPVFRFGALEVDTGSKSVRLQGREIELTSYEYNTLEYLIHRAGQVISKTEFTEHLYHQD